MTSDPSPFVQGVWMHGFAPVVLAGVLAFAVGFIVFGYLGARCHEDDDGTEMDDLNDYFVHRWENGDDA